MTAALTPVRFADLYDEMYPKLLRYFAGQTQDAQTAMDLTAETFARAFERRGQLRGETFEAAAAWVWTIARHELSRFRRSHAVELAALTRLGLERPAPTDDELRHIEQAAAFEEVRTRLAVEVAKLTADQQEVLRLYFVENLTYQQIADELVVSQDVVRARASRGLRALGCSTALHGLVEELHE